MDELISKSALLEYLESVHDVSEWLVSQYNADWIYSWLESQPTIEQPKWIPVTERLPEPNENPVLAVFFGVVNPAWCYSGLWELPSGIISDKVTHWMPLPEPYKENTDE